MLSEKRLKGQKKRSSKNDVFVELLFYIEKLKNLVNKSLIRKARYRIKENSTLEKKLTTCKIVSKIVLCTSFLEKFSSSFVCILILVN